MYPSISNSTHFLLSDCQLGIFLRQYLYCKMWRMLYALWFYVVVYIVQFSDQLWLFVLLYVYIFPTIVFCFCDNSFLSDFSMLLQVPPWTLTRFQVSARCHLQILSFVFWALKSHHSYRSLLLRLSSFIIVSSSLWHIHTASTGFPMIPPIAITTWHNILRYLHLIPNIFVVSRILRRSHLGMQRFIVETRLTFHVSLLTTYITLASTTLWQILNI